jgi:hypothetical protein
LGGPWNRYRFCVDKIGKNDIIKIINKGASSQPPGDEVRAEEVFNE